MFKLLRRFDNTFRTKEDLQLLYFIIFIIFIIFAKYYITIFGNPVYTRQINHVNISKKKANIINPIVVQARQLVYPTSNWVTDK